MATMTITFRVDAAEHHDIAVRAERDKVSLSDYIRLRLGLPGEGPQDAGAMTATDEQATQAQLDDHDRRLTALEAGRAAAASP